MDIVSDAELILEIVDLICVFARTYKQHCGSELPCPLDSIAAVDDYQYVWTGYTNSSLAYKLLIEHRELYSTLVPDAWNLYIVRQIHAN